MYNCLLPLLILFPNTFHVPGALIPSGIEALSEAAVADSCPDSRGDSGLGEIPAAPKRLPQCTGVQSEGKTCGMAGVEPGPTSSVQGTLKEGLRGLLSSAAPPASFHSWAHPGAPWSHHSLTAERGGFHG